MSPPTLQNRSALHHRRGLHLARAATTTADVPGPDGTPAAKTTTPVAVPNRPNDKTTATPEKSSTLVAVLPTILPATTSTTSLPTSSTSSAISVPVTASVTTSSLPTTHSIPTTSATPHVVIQTTTRFTSSTSAAQRPSASAQASGGLGTGAIIGGIGGALAGVVVLSVIIAFFIRRWRKRAVENAFDSSQFRRSAVLLDEKDDNTHGPRPPSMFERRNVASTIAPLSALSAAYPYFDQPPTPSSAPLSFTARNQFGGNGGVPNAPAMGYGANPYAMDYGQGGPITYGTPSQGYEQNGAPPVPGTYGPGAYALYGADPGHLQYQRHLPQHAQQQRQQYSRQYPQQYQPHESSSAALTRQGTVSSLVNPFSPPPVPKKMLPAEDRGSASSSSPPPSFVTRQPAQPHEALPGDTNDGGYTDMERDVKVPLSNSASLLRVVNDSSEPASPDTKVVGTTTTTRSNGRATEPRPLSSYTLYDDNDAYGGM